MKDIAIFDKKKQHLHFLTQTETSFLHQFNQFAMRCVLQKKKATFMIFIEN